VPHFTVHAVDDDLDGREPELIHALTEAVVLVYGERARQLVGVQLIGLPLRRWGIGGRPAARVAPSVTLTMREPALSMPGAGDPPARLIESITDAVSAVCGEHLRAEIVIEIVGIPAGRSGVGGVPV
jgi:phenylpyruvate tautomerase PptA (4-oxalocrotonate tautomerase family)